MGYVGPMYYVNSSLLLQSTPATSFDHFSNLKNLVDKGLNNLPPDTLGAVLRAMVPTKQLLFVRCLELILIGTSTIG